MDHIAIAGTMLVASLAGLGCMHTSIIKASGKAAAALARGDYENAQIERHLPMNGWPHTIGLYLAVVCGTLSVCGIVGEFLHAVFQ